MWGSVGALRRGLEAEGGQGEGEPKRQADIKEEEAAIKIQSKARGMLAKKKVEQKKQEKAAEVMPESPEQTVVSKAPKAT